MQLGGGASTEEEEFAADRKLVSAAGEPPSKRRRLEVEAPDLGDKDDDEVGSVETLNPKPYGSSRTLRCLCLSTRQPGAWASVPQKFS